MRTAAIAILCCAATVHAQEPVETTTTTTTTVTSTDYEVVPPPVVRPPRRRHDILLRADLGGVYRRALDRNFGGAGLDLEVGWDGRSMSVGGRFGVEVGGTQSLVPYQHLQWGVGVDGKIGSRVRLGVVPTVGALLISRVSREGGGESLPGLTFSALGECIVAILGPGQPSKRTHPGLDFVVRGGYEWVDVSPRSSKLVNGASLKLALGGRY